METHIFPYVKEPPSSDSAGTVMLASPNGVVGEPSPLSSGDNPPSTMTRRERCSGFPLVAERKPGTGTSHEFFDAALAMALDRLGGSITYTQAEYLAVRARRGRYRLKGTVDKSVDPPTITVELAPSPAKEGDVVN